MNDANAHSLIPQLDRVAERSHLRADWQVELISSLAARQGHDTEPQISQTLVDGVLAALNEAERKH